MSGRLDATDEIAAPYLAFIDHPASAFCDELVEVLGEIQGLAMIRDDAADARWCGSFEPTDRLQPPPAPRQCPYPRDTVASIYRHLIGRAPPASATPGMIWVVALRKMGAADHTLPMPQLQSVRDKHRLRSRSRQRLSPTRESSGSYPCNARQNLAELRSACMTGRRRRIDRGGGPAPKPTKLDAVREHQTPRHDPPALEARNRHRARSQPTRQPESESPTETPCDIT